MGPSVKFVSPNSGLIYENIARGTTDPVGLGDIDDKSLKHQKPIPDGCIPM